MIEPREFYKEELIGLLQSHASEGITAVAADIDLIRQAMFNSILDDLSLDTVGRYLPLIISITQKAITTESLPDDDPRVLEYLADRKGLISTMANADLRLDPGKVSIALGTLGILFRNAIQSREIPPLQAGLGISKE